MAVLYSLQEGLVLSEDAKRVAQFIGAERLIEFEIDHVLEITDASPLRWRFGEYSPDNPT